MNRRPKGKDDEDNGIKLGSKNNRRLFRQYRSGASSSNRARVSVT